MFEAAAFSYGLIASFVLAGVERNHRERRPHAPVLVYAGYVLCGSLGGGAVALGGYVAARATGLL